jgi:Flp pilus assembly protein protease CpaA
VQVKGSFQVNSVISVCFVAASLLMIWAAWVDWREFRIPYMTIFGLDLFGLVYNYERGISIADSIALSVTVGILLLVIGKIGEIWRKKPILGYGDIQLIMASLLWINLTQLSFFFIVAGVCGLGLSWLFQKEGYFPFAPGIATAWFVSFI